MKLHETVLTDLLGRALFGASVTVPPDVDWQALCEETFVQSVSALVLDALTDEERARIPAELLETWKKRVLMYSATGLQLLYEQDAVLALLGEHGIPVAVLKGSSVACHYPNPALRAMGDIDLLVPPDRQRETVDILRETGYGDILEEGHHCHYTISKGRISVEVHREPNGIHIATDPEIAASLHAYFADATDHIHTVGHIPVLSTDRQAVVLLLHKLEHFLSGGLGLRQLCDWACFVKACLSPDEFERLRPTLVDFGLLEFAGIVTRVCCDHLHLPVEAVPWCMDFDRDLACEVLESIVDNGNFGRKDREGSYGQHLFSEFGSSNRVTSFFRALGRSCRHNWPICARVKILMPVAPFVVAVRYLILYLRGERPAFHPVQMYRKAGPKQKLYRSLKPFQREEKEGTDDIQNH